MKRIFGLSLVELMISLFIASLLLTFITKHFWLSKYQFKKISATLEEQMEINLVLRLIQMSIRNAGFTACLSINVLNSYDSRNGNLKIKAIHFKPNELVINSLSEEFREAELEEGQNKLFIPDTNFNLKANKPLLIHDCNQAEIHEILRTIKTDKGFYVYLKKPLKFNFNNPIYVGEWIEDSFSIQKNKKGEKALFLDKGKPEELTSLIKGLKTLPILTKDKELLKITLSLKANQSFSFTTLIRTSNENLP